MTHSRDEHRVFIVNEETEAPYATPEVLRVRPGDKVLFVVAGDEAKFFVHPETDVFRSIPAGQEIPVSPGSPPTATVRRDAEINSVHHYEVQPQASAAAIDPILIIHD